MISFLLALQFLTIIPVKIKQISGKKIAESMIYFPLVGLLLGLALVGINNLLYALNFPQLSINTILVILLIALTGAIHLDGLSDTFDAFFSGKNKEEMLEIMRDHHAGVMGVLSIVSIILLKISFLYAINRSLKGIALCLACIFSRWSLVFLMFLFPYARKEGKAKIFIQGINLKILLLSTAVALISAIVIWKIKGLLLLLIIAACAYLIGKFISKKIGGITGDALGAVNEITETLTLFFICIIEKSNLWII